MCNYVILMDVLIGPKFYHKNLYATYLLYGLPMIAKRHCLDVAVGKTCNYVILMAQLHTQGKKRGIHAFVVQIRSLTDHKPMPGTGHVYMHQVFITHTWNIEHLLW